MTLDKYVGRIVRLNQNTFNEIAKQARNQETVLENCFLVASVNRAMRKLICYGGSIQIAVDVSEVVLI